MEGRIGDIKRCTRCNTCLVRCLSGLPPACPFNPNLGREYALDEYRIGPRQKHEAIMPKAVTNAPMPALERPWWKREIPLHGESYWRKFRGPGPQTVETDLCRRWTRHRGKDESARDGQDGSESRFRRCLDCCTK